MRQHNTFFPFRLDIFSMYVMYICVIGKNDRYHQHKTSAVLEMLVHFVYVVYVYVISSNFTIRRFSPIIILRLVVSYDTINPLTRHIPLDFFHYTHTRTNTGSRIRWLIYYCTLSNPYLLLWRQKTLCRHLFVGLPWVYIFLFEIFWNVMHFWFVILLKVKFELESDTEKPTLQ